MSRGQISRIFGVYTKIPTWSLSFSDLAVTFSIFTRCLDDGIKLEEAVNWPESQVGVYFVRVVDKIIFMSTLINGSDCAVTEVYDC